MPWTAYPICLRMLRKYLSLDLVCSRGHPWRQQRWWHDNAEERKNQIFMNLPPLGVSIIAVIHLRPFFTWQVETDLCCLMGCYSLDSSVTPNPSATAQLAAMKNRNRGYSMCWTDEVHVVPFCYDCFHYVPVYNVMCDVGLTTMMLYALTILSSSMRDRSYHGIESRFHMSLLVGAFMRKQ